MSGNSGSSLTPERVAKFKTAVDGMKKGEGKVFILFTQPDPDAIASAIVLQQVLSHLECNSQIIYSGKISHPQNVLLVNTFNLDRLMAHISSVEIGEKDYVLLVDSHQIKESRLSVDIGNKKPVVIIDHHRSDSRIEECPVQFYWIEDCGACVTLVYLLAQELGVVLDKETMVLVVLGIYTDTKNLVGASSRDLSVYSSVIIMDGVQDDFSTLIKYPLPPSFYELLGYILSNNTVHKWNSGPVLLCSAGIINGDERDLLAIVADLLLREDGVSLVIVYGIILGPNGNCSIVLSARSSNLSVPLDKFLAKAFSLFGDKVSGAKVTPDGRGEGGALLPLNLGPWVQPYSISEIKKLVSECMRHWIFPVDDDKEEEEIKK